ncbi:TasA family protein [Halorhabdus salina]|uniref:TasA family protein n=1 Tax=Halorhabdus salina TaxID=2750670 RepID=UPI0015EF1DA0|nr:TasA family protein [Halorhabdus salina]
MTEIELTRRRILAGVLVIGLAAAAAGVGTFALFSDEATSPDNTINAGTLNLDPVDGNFTVDNIYPTQSTTQNITTSYQESGDIGSNLNVSISTADPSNAFSDQLDVDSAVLKVDGSTVETLADSGTLSDLEGTHSGLTTLNGGEDIALEVTFTLGEDTSNTFQGDSLDITVSFNATQQTE